jgi:hypothetical protein
VVVVVVEVDEVVVTAVVETVVPGSVVVTVPGSVVPAEAVPPSPANIQKSRMLDPASTAARSAPIW